MKFLNESLAWDLGAIYLHVAVGANGLGRGRLS